MALMVKYQNLAESLKRQIQRGFYRENDYIPSEQELAELYNVSKITVRGAINLLTEEQMLVKERGKRTRVISSEPTKKIIPRQNMSLGIAFDSINLYSDISDMPAIIHGITSHLNPWKENLSLFPFETHRDQVELFRHLLEKNVLDGVFLLTMGKHTRDVLSFLQESAFPHLLIVPSEDDFLEDIAKDFTCPALFMDEQETIRSFLEKHLHAGTEKAEIFGIEGLEVERTIKLFEKCRPSEHFQIQKHIFMKSQDYFSEIVKLLGKDGKKSRLLVIGTTELAYYMDSALNYCGLYNHDATSVVCFKHYSSMNKILGQKFTVIDRDLHKLGMKAAEIMCGLVRQDSQNPIQVRLKNTISEIQ